MGKGLPACSRGIGSDRAVRCSGKGWRVTHHSLSETLHFDDYVDSHMYSARILGASAARRRTLARVNRGVPTEKAAQDSHEGGLVYLIGETDEPSGSHNMLSG